jgi:pilus assembly protein CpaB
MSSALRLSIIMVLLLASTALGLIAYSANAPKAQLEVVAKEAAAPRTVAYFVAARPLARGTLARNEDFATRNAAPDSVPAGAIIDTPDAKAGLPGSLVRNFMEAGSPIRLEDILRPKDRGFLASVLAPDSRAISIKVDEESGVSGLIRPGDYVDVLLTLFEKNDPARRNMSEAILDKTEERILTKSEMILANVRVIAIDQEIAQGGRPASAVVGKQAQTVSLELTSEQVKTVIVAKQLGALSLAVRAAAEQWDRANTEETSSCEASAKLARQKALAGQSTMVAVRSRGSAKQYFVKREDPDADAGCDVLRDAGRQAADAGRAGASAARRR